MAEYHCLHLETLFIYFFPWFSPHLSCFFLQILHFVICVWELVLGQVTRLPLWCQQKHLPVNQEGGLRAALWFTACFKSFSSLQGSKASEKSARCPDCLGRQRSLALLRVERAQSVLAPCGDLKLDVGNRRAVVFWVVLPSLAGGRVLLMPASQQGLRGESGHDKYRGVGMSERGRGTSPCPLVLLPLTTQTVTSQPHLPSLSKGN